MEKGTRGKRSEREKRIQDQHRSVNIHWCDAWRQYAKRVIGWIRVTSFGFGLVFVAFRVAYVFELRCVEKTDFKPLPRKDLQERSASVHCE